MSRKSRAKPPSPFRRFNSSPEVIRLVVMMYVRFPLSLRNVEDLLFERGIKSLQKFASVHANFHNHVGAQRHLVNRQTSKAARSVALAEWQDLAA